MKKHKIIDIIENSIAYELDIKKGDHLISVNKKEIVDFLDYNLEIYNDLIELEIESDIERTIFEIEKYHDEDIGLVFENEMMDLPRRCENKCIFCFVDQLPKNMRKTLYFKDDDIRMSFLNGNYVTLTNTDEKELKRIIDLRISPINISVHSTDPNIRVKLLGNKKAGSILDQIKYLLDNGIDINAQFVIIKGINDDESLKRSLQDIYNLDKMINSISVVPVGITRFRDSNMKIEAIDKETANETVKIVDSFRELFIKKYGRSIIYSADELYIIADLMIPSYSYYEDFPQFENGVGLVRHFCEEFEQNLKEKEKETIIKNFSIVTSESFYEYIIKLIRKFDNDDKIKVHKIKNNFFGKTVTVSGLLTFSDIEEQLRNIDINDTILLPGDMFKQNEDLTLDGYSLKDFKEVLKRDIKIIANDAKSLCDVFYERN